MKFKKTKLQVHSKKIFLMQRLVTIAVVIVKRTFQAGKKCKQQLLHARTKLNNL